MKKTLLKSLALAVVGSFCLVGAANALMLDGDISLSGGFTPIDISGTKTTLLLATGIDFTQDIMNVVGTSGDFNVIAYNTPGNIYDFQFNPLPIGGVNLWSVSGFSFDLTSVIIDTHDATNLSITGSGTMYGAGYDPTPGSWSLTSQTLSDATSFSWSSTNDAAPVPEPATMMLFGTGLIGLASIGRRKKKQMQAM